MKSYSLTIKMDDKEGYSRQENNMGLSCFEIIGILDFTASRWRVAQFTQEEKHKKESQKKMEAVLEEAKIELEKEAARRAAEAEKDKTKKPRKRREKR